MKSLCIGLSIILVSLIIIAGNWSDGSSANSTPSETVEQYYKLALDGKIEEALTFWTDCNLTPEGFCSKAASTSGDDINERWTKRIYKYKYDFTIENEKVKDNQASVLVYIKLPNGYTDKTIYKMIKADGKWKLYTLSSPAAEEADRIAEEAYRRNNPEEEQK